METAAVLTEMMERVTASLPTGHTGAGDPLRSLIKVVNGHRVTVKMIGWDENPPVFEIDYSTEPLTFDAAVAAL